MFEWSQGTSLKAMMNAGVPAAQFDDWLEGWMFGFIQSRLELQTPLEVLDVALGVGERPYLETFEKQGCKIARIDADSLSGLHADSGGRQYDLITLLSLQRDECLRPLDLDNPLPELEILLKAAALLEPGGVLVWSYLYCFSSSPDHLHSLLEPAAVYQAILRRGFRPLVRHTTGVGRVAMLFDTDTLFVRHRPILAASDHNERVTRICAGILRPGPTPRVRYLRSDEALTFAVAPAT